MALERIPIEFEGEELPTDERIKYLAVEILTKEERDRIAALQEKIDRLLVSGVLSPQLAQRLDALFSSMERVAEKMSSVKTPYDIEQAIEDLGTKVQTAMAGIVRGDDCRGIFAGQSAGRPSRHVGRP